MSFFQKKPRAIVRTGIFPYNRGYRTIAGRKIYFKSGWETNYAHFLQFLKEKGVIQEWEYEPQAFIFEKIQSGTRKYIPDFKVTRPDGTHYWVEVKGYMDQKSKTKISRFRKYFSKEELVVVEKEWFRNHMRAFPVQTDHWENEFTPSAEFDSK